MDAGGNLYVLEEDTYRVQKLDPRGGFLAKWGLRTAEGELYEPEDIAVDAGAGAVYVADNDNTGSRSSTPAGSSSPPGAGA